MSAVHVFYGDKLTTVAHLVVGDQLPLPSSVSFKKWFIDLSATTVIIEDILIKGQAVLCSFKYFFF